MRTLEARTALGLLLASILVLGGCEPPPHEATQGNFRGLGIEQVINTSTAAALREANQAPPTSPPLPANGPPSTDVFQNVKALGHVDAGNFTRLMGAMTTWVAPKGGCVYCHNGGNFASEDVYTKIVARRMIQMTQHINSEWKDHVGDTGVTCYTCHRGNPVPSNYWTLDPESMAPPAVIGDKAGQNAPAMRVGLTSLPNDPFGAYLESTSSNQIGVQSKAALPGSNNSSIKQTEWTYGLMVHMSNSLGVNCTYCHNSRSFGVWGASSPARATAWHGIRMVRDVNENYLTPLADVFPDERKGPLGDTFKVNCATCHQGVNKPLYGAQMAKDYPSLQAPGPVYEAPGESEPMEPMPAEPTEEAAARAATEAASTQGGQDAAGRI